MEEKKLDKSSLIGMALITGLLIWMMSGNMFSDKKKKNRNNYYRSCCQNFY